MLQPYINSFVTASTFGKVKILVEVLSSTPKVNHEVSKTTLQKQQTNSLLSSSKINVKTNQPSCTASTISKVKVLPKSSSSTNQCKTEICKSFIQKHQTQSLPCSSKTRVKTNQPSKRFKGCGLVYGLGDNPMNDNEEQNGVLKYKRPPYTYLGLIASAILDSEHHLVTLKEIYGYIKNNFPYYKFHHKEEQWKNSIRHNLSANNFFINGLLFFLF